MQTECVRCHKMIDTVQGYKFSPTEYVCMACYDEYKAERAAKAKKQHKNPLIDQFGTEGAATTARQAPSQPAPRPREPGPRPTQQEGPSQAAAPEPAPQPKQAPPLQGEPVQAPAPPKAAPSAEVCDVCKRPIPDFKVPLKGGKKVCMGCNDILRSVAKSLVLNIQCPHCGKEIQLTQE